MKVAVGLLFTIAVSAAFLPSPGEARASPRKKQSKRRSNADTRKDGKGRLHMSKQRRKRKPCMFPGAFNPASVAAAAAELPPPPKSRWQQQQQKQQLFEEAAIKMA